ncbi:hypothetical protein L1987_03739 [Smallanthus sonchifolius]|uniref:Uncharacterized protein n=1 Tax=Smallanthus sonchifolius TaxID=185202 RepID=A0ACB9KBI5_9ASTR|nr:hypothetical protein L1987_03739 [Smallanthus sonchifolius]
MLTSETASNVTSPRTNKLSPFSPSSGGLRLAEASAAEEQAANAVWQAAQAQAANPEEIKAVSDDSQHAESNSEGGDTEGDVRLHSRAVCFLTLMQF